MSRFVKGQSGNPGGRRKLPDDIVRLCRDITREGVEELKRISRESKDDGVRVRAIDTVLNRGWGQAPQTVMLEGDTRITIVTPLTKRKEP